MPLPRRSVWPHCDSPAPAEVAGEKDACGVGFLAQLSGEPSHWLLEQALRGLGCMEHRGGCGGDGDSGDGAGVLCGIPWSYLGEVWPESSLAPAERRGLAMVFLPVSEPKRQEVKRLCEQAAAQVGLRSLGWREVPVDPSVLGPLALQTVPRIEQWLVEGPEPGDALESLLFRCRRRAVDMVRAAPGVIPTTSISPPSAGAPSSTRAWCAPKCSRGSTPICAIRASR